MNAKSTKAKFPPKYLYRYYGNPEYILDVLMHRRLYHSHPNEFNDPFDCKPFISIRHQTCTCIETWFQAFYYLNKIRFPDLSDEDAAAFAKEAIDKNKHAEPDFLAMFENDINTIGDPLRVCCFADSPRNPMMWAHYARSYKGVVFQLRTGGLWNVKTKTFRGFPVDYREHPLALSDYVSALRDFHDKKDYRSICKLFYCTKSHHWINEQEVRFFSNSDKKHIEFDESTLQSIIFGSKCSEALERTIRKTTESWAQKPRLYRISTDRSGFKLYIENG